MSAKPDSSQIDLHLFGALADHGREMSNTLILPDEIFSKGTITVSALIDHLAVSHPELAMALRAPGIRLALNKVLCPMNSLIQAGDEVAFMSPLSGG